MESAVTPSEQTPYFTIKEMAKRYRVHTATIKEWSRTGVFPPPLKLGRRVLWDINQVEAHLARQRQGARPMGDPAIRLHGAEPAESAPLVPLVTDIHGLSVLLSRSVPALERDQAAGRIPRPLRLGRSKRWSVDEIREWVAAGMPSRREWETRRRK